MVSLSKLIAGALFAFAAIAHGAEVQKADAAESSKMHEIHSKLLGKLERSLGKASANELLTEGERSDSRIKWKKFKWE